MLTMYDARGTVLPAGFEGRGLPSGVVLIDLLRPDPAEIAYVQRVTGLTLPTSQRMSEVEVSSRLAMQRKTLQVTSPIVYRTDAVAVNTSPVGFMLSEKLLITLRFVDLKSFDDFLAQKPFRVADPAQAAIELFLGLLETIVDRMADAMEQIGADLDRVSRGIFRPETGVHATDKPTVIERRLNRALRTIGQNGDHTSHARDSLLGLGRLIAYVGTHTGERLPDGLKARLETLKQDVGSLNDYEGRLSDKVQFLLDSTLGFINIEQNRLFKLLTIASVMGVPPTFVVGLYGMNFKNMPEVDWSYGYQFGWAMILVSILIPGIWLKRKGWF
ncbi:magnesium transporter CorA family protein [Lichenihabitans sp. Uapishka_5]|uniref:magnesium transporter CorA family protein n=1 Tax=Lichenihabitans sp. Uapishka_5 TaxID=3037302 RepID=UPI0029E81756|nr:magnesium transporter CorA family protein [Lichenihabitans sp. Uapishka_5]MDX7951056.1 magnesium transporter CorA family protein [Lichenihabitans sp. Uapishka_5]